MISKIINAFQYLSKKIPAPFNRFATLRKFIPLRKLNIYNRNQSIRGYALLIYIAHPFYIKENGPSFRAHINVRNARLLVKVLNDLGYCVDVIDYQDKNFESDKIYDIVIGIGGAFDSQKQYLKNSKIKIYYATGMHYITETNLIYQRHMNLRNRKGKFISPKRINTPYFSPEKSDFIISVQNEFTNKTYSHLNVPLYSLTLSGDEPDSPQNLLKTKNTKTILWFSGPGMILKGLDLVLDAVSQVKDCNLVICANLFAEDEFKEIYSKELYDTSNITFQGFADVGSLEFKKIITECVAVIYPYPEGEMSGSLMTCMNYGLIPIIAYFSNDEISEFAEYVDGTVKGIKDTLIHFCKLSDDVILEKSRKSLEYAQRYHSREKEYFDYKFALEDIIEKTNL